MSSEHRRFGMGLFGRKKKNKSMPALTDTTLPELAESNTPQVDLPHVETHLNMHQHNGLFEVASPERQERPNGSLEPAAGEYLCPPPRDSNTD